MTDKHATVHEVIWLQPWCDGCESANTSDGRLWCPHDVWGQCEECEQKPVRYELAPAERAQKAEAEVARLRALLLDVQLGTLTTSE
jgi:hypothetical protein